MSFARTTAAVVLAALTLLVHDAGAQTLSKCGAGKKKCVSKKVAGLLKCHAKAEKKGLAVESTCLQKVRDKFDGGSDPTKGCFAKLEAKDQNCLTFGDTAAVENQVDAFVNEIICQLDPAAGTCPIPTASPTCPGPPTPQVTPTPPPCVPTGPETCNNLDDDCNGQIDDGLGTTTCGVGGCQNTVPNCSMGSLVMCNPGMPTGETCNGIDDDCDGSVDEGLGSTICGTGACQVTQANCVMGIPQMCTPGLPSTEVCNNVDDNCDGIVDNVPPIQCGVGVCHNTAPGCIGGLPNFSCTPNPPTSLTEICGNGLDDNCNGSVDEGC